MAADDMAGQGHATLRADWMFVFSRAAHNLVLMRNLIVQPDTA